MTLVRSKHRALSTVVSTAIMLSFVATIGTAVVAWSNTNVRTYETGLTSSAADKTSKINEMFAIENVAMLPKLSCPTCNWMNITVTNTGTEGISIPEIQISDSTQTPLDNKTTKAYSILPKSSRQFNESYNWGSNVLTTIQVTTTRGTLITTQVSHP